MAVATGVELQAYTPTTDEMLLTMCAKFPLQDMPHRLYSCNEYTVRKLLGYCRFSHRMLILVDDPAIRELSVPWSSFTGAGFKG